MRLAGFAPMCASARATVAASWESYVVDELFRRTPDSRHYFWRTTNGAELDLVIEEPSGTRLGFEIKRADAPRMTP